MLRLPHSNMVYMVYIVYMVYMVYMMYIVYMVYMVGFGITRRARGRPAAPVCGGAGGRPRRRRGCRRRAFAVRGLRPCTRHKWWVAHVVG